MDDRPNHTCRRWYVIGESIKMSLGGERFCGIDYGTKMSGNTALAYLDNIGIHVLQCPKNTDADQWITTQVTLLNLQKIYLDAPLSLPGGYLGFNDQFHYRACDLELSAMSPMFLGGLTARAIALSKGLEKLKITSYEVYPGGFIRMHSTLQDAYHKKDSSTVAKMVESFSRMFHFPIQTPIENYHQVDALICWWIGYRHTQGLAKAYGDEKEGQIWI
jgi:uncharacterized protein